MLLTILFILFQIHVFPQLASHTVLRKKLLYQYLPSFPNNSHNNTKKRSRPRFCHVPSTILTSRTSSKVLLITICRCSAAATQLFLATSKAFIEMSLLCFVHICMRKRGAHSYACRYNLHSMQFTTCQLFTHNGCFIESNSIRSVWIWHKDRPLTGLVGAWILMFEALF